MTYSLICFASVDPAQAVTLFMWKCCYDVLREWWSFYRSLAANSFHPPNLRWLMPRLLFFFPHGLVPPCVISERRVCFWFNFQITCMWEHCWTSHVSLKIQLTYRFKGETMWAHCLRYYMVIHLGGMHPLGSLCGSRLVCILIWMPQPELYFNMTAKSIPPVFFMSSHLKRNHYVTDAANNVFWFRQHKSTLVSHFRRTATAQKQSTKNVCHDWRVTKSVSFFRFVCIVATRQQHNYSWIDN